jgi:hypothetical protein
MKMDSKGEQWHEMAKADKFGKTVCKHFVKFVKKLAKSWQIYGKN